ncbi:hypothetical protein GCM10029964_078680 [Kibdelosporangium lantanae]
MRILRALLPLALLVALAQPARAAGDIHLCVTVGRNAGFTGEDFVTAVAVAMAESRCDPLARGSNPGSVDRGLWQINDYYHPEVSDACAYDAQCNANAAYRISDGGTDWTQWSTYQSKAYRQFLDDARAAIGASPPPVRAAKSVNGDRYDDAVAVDASGTAWYYPGRSSGGFGTAVRIGPGWSAYTTIAVNDADADGLADLFAVKAGTLYYWHRTTSGFSPAVEVGPGWSGMEWMSFADVNGDNKADILARDGGNMYVYIGKGQGRFAARYLLGPGWSSLTRHTSADADADADGDGDIWATNGAGELFFWEQGADGSLATAVQVGSGWNAYRQMVAMDVNGDGRADLVAVRSSDNTLWQWLGKGDGRFGQGTPIGNGWGDHALAVN